MLMEDVRVSMKLNSLLIAQQPYYPVEVTEITEKGFKYRLDARENLCIVPRMGLVMQLDGHEHFGVNGNALFDEHKEEVLP
jgi:hypothetical protein